jgi:hypothetical protein
MPPELIGAIKITLAGSASSFPVVMVPVAPPMGSSVQGTSICMALTSMSGPLLVMKTSMSKSWAPLTFDPPRGTNVSVNVLAWTGIAANNKNPQKIEIRLDFTVLLLWLTASGKMPALPRRRVPALECPPRESRSQLSPLSMAPPEMMRDLGQKKVNP